MVPPNPKLHSGAHTVAVIIAEGSITGGPSEQDWSKPHPTSIGSDTMCAAIRQAAKDKTIKAILLRINSGGGSYTASDLMNREIVNAQAAGKKVVVSMGNVAASGGYFMALSADRVLASPGTITGSIGVLAGKMNMKGLYEQHLGINYDSILTSENASLNSSLHAYTESQTSFMERVVDYIYHDFTHKVAKGRHLAIEKVEAAAQGRVWMGTTALTLGLVDELGGWHESLAAVRSVSGLSADAPLHCVSWPPRPTLLQKLLGDPSPPRNTDERDQRHLSAVPTTVPSSFPIAASLPSIAMRVIMQSPLHPLRAVIEAFQMQNMSLSNSSAPLAQGAFNSHALGGVDVQLTLAPEFTSLSASVMGR